MARQHKPLFTPKECGMTLTNRAKLRPGDCVRFKICSWVVAAAKFGSLKHSEFTDGKLILQAPSWGELMTE